MSSGIEQPKFCPINPLDLDPKSGLDFFRTVRRLADGPEEFVGSRDVIRLTEQRLIGVGVTIRFHHAGLPEFQLITQRGLLPVNYGNDREILKRMLIEYPFKVLDSNPLVGGRPYKWGVYGFDFISNKEINRILGINPN